MSAPTETTYCLGQLNYLTDKETERLFKDYDWEQAQRVQKMVGLYNKKQEARIESLYHTDCEEDPKEKEELRKKLNVITGTYQAEKEKCSDIMESIPAILSQAVYDRTPFISVAEFEEKMGSNPKLTPLGVIKKASFSQLKELFPHEKPIIRVENRKGSELVMISGYCKDKKKEMITILFHTPEEKCLSVLYAVSEMDDEKEKEEAKLGFRFALNTMVLIHCRILYDGENTSLGFKPLT